MTTPILHIIALICSGLFAGGAMMQSIVDHPARLAIGGECGIRQMQGSLHAADPYMPLLAVGGAGAALWAYLLGAGALELAASVSIVTVVPFTWLLIIPVNKRIHSFRPGHQNAEEILRLMRRWGRLHAVRSGLGTTTLILLGINGAAYTYLF